MSKELKWGMIGLGKMAEEFATTLTKVANLYAVASNTEKTLENFKNKFEVEKSYNNYEDLVNDPDIDIVYIATINSVHYDNIKLALNAGKNVLCEKAIWHNYSEFMELREIAEHKGLVLAEAMTLFHMPLIDEVMNRIKHGVIGEVRLVSANFGSVKDDSENNRFFSKELGGGAMLDIGTYALSFLSLFMTGDFEDINALTSKHSKGVDENWFISAVDEKGVFFTSDICFRSKLAKRATISGSKGYIEIDNYVRADKATVFYLDGSKEIIELGDSSSAVEYEILDIEKTVKGLEDKSYIQNTSKAVKVIDYLFNK